MLGRRREIFTIAKEIWADWSAQGKNFPHAFPYLEAMHQLDRITDDYGCDSAKSVVLYFLANVQSWRGETAKRIKAELKALCK